MNRRYRSESDTDSPCRDAQLVLLYYDGRTDRASLQGDVSMYCVKIVRQQTHDRASLQWVTRLCPLRLSGRRGLHSVVLELLGIEAAYLALALVHLSTGVLYIYVCGVLVEVGTLLRCDE